MNKFFIFLTIFLEFCSSLVAQSVHGIVVDATGAPMAFVNIVELSQVDSTFIGGTISQEDGTFLLENVKSSNLLRASYTGYDTQYVNYTGQSIITFKLKECTTMLGEVVVKSHLPKTILNGEGMSTIVAGSVLEKSSNMEQLLSRIPNVSAKDGQIEVFGRGTPIIYINGRKMQDNMDLQRLQPNDIRR